VAVAEALVSRGGPCGDASAVSDSGTGACASTRHGKGVEGRQPAAAARKNRRFGGFIAVGM